MTMTQTAQVIGTAQYLSPEQARGERVDARSDLYSTGCLLYELLTGRPPFTGDSPVAIAYQHVKEEPIPPSQIDPEVPAWADAIVLKAMRKDPADRYQSAGEMRNDIQRALSGAPLAAAMPPTATYAGATRRMGAAQTQVAGRTSSIPPYDYGPPGYGPDGGGPGGPPRRQRRAWPWVTLAVVVAVLVAVIVLLKFIGSGTSAVSIPSVAGDTVPQATSALTGAGFHVGSQVNQTSATVPSDHVINTIPGGGNSATKGSTIKLIVSTGAPAAKTVTVPYVINKTKEQAQAALSAQGFQVNVQTQQQAGTPPDTVFNETPPGNSQAKRGSTVTIEVTPAGQTVPDVTGQSFGQAQATLSGPPYNYNVVEQAGSGPGAPGTVQSTSPGPGANLAPGGQIIVFVIPQSQPSSPPPSPSPSASPSDTTSPGTGGAGH